PFLLDTFSTLPRHFLGTSLTLPRHFLDTASTLEKWSEETKKKKWKS
ncbi:21225_t:CDS:1, partial [Gigaspora rosea]